MKAQILLRAPLAVAVLFFAGLAAAQDLAVAEAQFNRGLEAMQAGNFAVGCPALAESQRLDPRPGTLFTLAECEAKWGHLATAMTRYEDYLSQFGRMSPAQQAKQQGREVIVAERKAALAAKVPRLTLVPPDDAPRGLAVSRGGVALALPSLGVALPVDPGEHVVLVEAPGYERHEQRIRILEGEVKELRLLLGAKLAVPTAPALAGAGEQGEAGAGPQRIAAYVVGGVGVAGLALGAITGAMTLGEKSTIDDQCVDRACSAEGLAATDSASTLGLVSTIGFGVGVAGVAASVILLLTERDDTPRAARAIVDVGPERAAIGLRGAF